MMMKLTLMSVRKILMVIHRMMIKMMTVGMQMQTIIGMTVTMVMSRMRDKVLMIRRVMTWMIPMMVNEMFSP